MKLPIDFLIEQGFLEEVKETLKPKWKVGDRVVRVYRGETPDYTVVFEISISSSGTYWFCN
jgi:hypothetical protein